MDKSGKSFHVCESSRHWTHSLSSGKFFVFYFIHFSLTPLVDGESSIPVHFKNAVTNRGKYVHKRLKCKRLIQRLTNIKVAVFMFDGVITL